MGLERALLCKSKLAWIKCGRHPRDQVEQIEKEYAIIKLGVATNGLPPKSGVHAGMNEEGDVKGTENAGYAPMEEKTREPDGKVEGDENEDKTTTTPI